MAKREWVLNLTGFSLKSEPREPYIKMRLTMHCQGRSTSTHFFFPGLRAALIALASIALLSTGYADDEPWKDLQEQNRILRAQLQTQQRQLDDLKAQVDRLAGSHENTSFQQPNDSGSAYGGNAVSDRKLVISGELGLAFFSASKDGAYHDEGFRVDDAMLRFEASIAPNTYFFGELVLSRREMGNPDFYLGELYLESENLSGLFGLPDRLITVRFGRVNIPFGEEYQSRGPLANPLITHSLGDVWGIDEGLEFYGQFGRASYTVAVQNGGSNTKHDFNADKSVTLRLGFDVTSKLHLSASGMRTGKLDSAREPVSEVWFGNGLFYNIGSSASTTFQAELAELDARYTWSNGHVLATVGRARYRDNDPLADNTRHFTYYQIEGVQSLNTQFYGALRLSGLRVDHGYQLSGISNLDKYFASGLAATELRRLSFGGGYRVNRSLVVKADYTLEDGEITNGASFNSRMFSFESALGF